jgi:hypothetical protein
MDVASVLEKVTVYRHGAVCERVARLGAAGGEARIRVVGLPLSARTTSLRARLVGADAVHVLDVRAAFDVTIGSEVDVAAEARALEAARQDTARLQQALEAVERGLAELGGLQPAFREPPRREGPRPAPLSAMIALGEFVDRRLDAAQTQRRALSLELADARERELTAAARLQEAGTAARTSRAAVTRAAIVTLTAAPPHECTLTIEYEVPGASWVPTYQLALQDGGGRLAMRASIAQRTGEDWTGVRLDLSTASLRRRTEIPELRSLRVGRAQPEPQRAGWRPTPPGLDGLFADYDAAAIVRPPPPRPASPMPPRPPAAAAPASFGAPPGAVGGGAPMMARSMPTPMAPMPMAPPSAAPAPEFFAQAAAPRRAMAKLAKEEAEFSDDGGAAASTGADLSLAPPPSGPSAAQLDYEGLQIAGPDGPTRGRLAPAPASTWMFVGVRTQIDVHVQVDVVVAALARAEQLADAIAHQAAPRDCVRVDAQGRFDYRYAAQAPADVPSNGAWTNVAVMTCDVELTPQYLCVPAVDPAVYRTLELTNRSANALLPGPVDVSDRGQFLLTTTLGAIGPGARGPRIGLGVEEGIAVARNVRFAESSGGLFGGTTVLAHEIEVQVDNRLASAVQLELRERVPVVAADEKDLKLEEHDAEPPWTAIDEPEDGVLVHGQRRWRVTVAAGGRATLTGKYTIRIPNDRVLVGGNRRS